MFACRTIDLGRRAYLETLELMRELVEWKRDPGVPELVLQVEHEPVLTMGRRAQTAEIRVPGSRLQRLGIAVHRVERGGLTTYHGPGQEVFYTLFDLRAMNLGVAEMVRRLEGAVIDTLQSFGIPGRRRKAFRGVWSGKEKIASIGLAVRHGISFHGLALNRDPDLTHFDLITPCGIQGVRMTSMRRLLNTPVDSGTVRRRLVADLGRRFDLLIAPWEPDRAADILQRRRTAC